MKICIPTLLPLCDAGYCICQPPPGIAPVGFFGSVEHLVLRLCGGDRDLGWGPSVRIMLRAWSVSGFSGRCGSITEITESISPPLSSLIVFSRGKLLYGFLV